MTPVIAGGSCIVFEKFGSDCDDSLEQFIEGGRFGHEAGNVLACRDPDIRLLVPSCGYRELHPKALQPQGN